ncbi:MAG TPA: aromatic ring-hydroxylating dioxygenase subunit alpha [Steroidobacteraceae bacterium]
MNARIHPERSITPEARGEEDFSLPGWIYWDLEFFELEKQSIFKKAWHLVCHLNDVPGTGDYQTFDFLGESILTVRGDDGRVRSFHNVCRHRASRLVDGTHGNCGRRITCPYHAWTYATDGRLVGVPMRSNYPGLEPARYGLAPLEQEIWHGFIFVRFAPGLPSVQDQMAPYAEEMTGYRFEEFKPMGKVRLRSRAVNWKNVSDNYSDGLHIPVAHPGLTRLFGKSYGIDAKEWVDKMFGTIEDAPSPRLSERMYQRLIKEMEPADAPAPMWNYYKLWPNVAFELYPDQIDFMQFVPVSPTETILREIAYALPDDRREMRAARYLNWRINRRVNLEDKALIERVQAGMASSSYTVGPLGEGELCLRSFGRRMRALFPECRQPEPPAKGWSVNRNTRPR